MVAGMLFVPGMDAISKYLSTIYGISPAFITFFRFVVQSCLLFVVLAFFSVNTGLGSRRIGINILRGVLIGVAVGMFNVAVKYMPIADAIAVFFVEPLILLMFSSVFLGEQVGWRRRIAAIVGLLGAGLIIQPSYEVFGLVSLLPLGTATVFSFYLILTRAYGAKDDPALMQFYSGIGGVLICSLGLLIGELFVLTDFRVVIPQDTGAYALLLLLGLIATVGHLMIVHAFRLAPASILAPFQYIEIISATILGYLVFGDFPDPLKWLGIAIIISAGMYTFLRERKLEIETNSGG